MSPQFQKSLLDGVPSQSLVPQHLPRHAQAATGVTGHQPREGLRVVYQACVEGLPVGCVARVADALIPGIFRVRD